MKALADLAAALIFGRCVANHRDSMRHFEAVIGVARCVGPTDPVASPAEARRILDALRADYLAERQDARAMMLRAGTARRYLAMLDADLQFLEGEVLPPVPVPDPIVVPLRSEPPLTDIPNRLRWLADQIETETQDPKPESIVVIAYDGEPARKDGINVSVFGALPGFPYLVGLLELAKHKVTGD